jgi:transketolase
MRFSPRVQTSQTLAEEAGRLRREIIEAFFACGGGHYGGSLSVLDLLLTLYRRILRVDPSEPRHPGRDRLILSKGHSAMGLYAVLRSLGFFDHPLSGYGQFHSVLEGHPDMTALPGIDFSTGSLGQGLSVGLGMVLGLTGSDPHVWVILGDGECQEGQVWEAAMLAARYRASRLHAVVDCNGYQEWGWPGEAGPGAGEPVPRLSDKWSAFGWRVFFANGHDYDELSETFRATSACGVPAVVLATTVKGRGFPLIERDPLRFHCTTVTAGEQAELLGGMP